MLNLSIKDENILEAQKSLFELANSIGINLSKEEKDLIRKREDNIEKALDISLN